MKTNQLYKIYNNLFWLGVLILFCLYWLPALVFGQKIYVVIHDNLDCDFVYLHLLVKTKTLFSYFSSSSIDQIMNGIPRETLRSGYNITCLLFFLFDSFTAYCINNFLVHLIAFSGSWLLFSLYNKNKLPKHIIFLLSLSFSIIPFYTNLGITVSGIPLLLYCFINIYNNTSKLYHYLGIIIFPLYSFTYFIAPFIFPIFVFFTIYHFVKTKKIHTPFILSWGLLYLIYLIIDLPIILNTLLKHGFVSQRVEWVVSANLFESIKKAFNLSIQTQIHSGKFFTIIIALTSIIVLFHDRNWFKKTILHYYYFIAFVVLFYGFYPYIINLFLPVTNVFLIVQLDRFYFLLPVLWYLIFFFSIEILYSIEKYKRFVLPILFAQVILIFTLNEELISNISQYLGYKPTSSFETYFQSNEYNNIKNYINMPQDSYRVVSVGLSPSIAQYNGFYTLDSYQNNYKLEYKHEFRKVIEKELDKSTTMKNYFDKWGSRCYVFSSEIFDSKNKTPKYISDLQINTKKLSELGCKYVISAIRINNFENIGLKFEKEFGNNIFLYKIN